MDDAVVPRKHPVPNNPNLNSKNCSLPKLTCLVLNDIQENPNNFHVKKKNLFSEWYFLWEFSQNNIDWNMPCDFHQFPVSEEAECTGKSDMCKWKTLALVTELLQT